MISSRVVTGEPYISHLCGVWDKIDGPMIDNSCAGMRSKTAYELFKSKSS